MDITQATAELLEVLKQGMVSGSKIISQQFPILCEQILRWGIVRNVCVILVSIFFTLVCLKTFAFGVSQIGEVLEKRDVEERTFPMILSVVATVFGIIFLIFLCGSVLEIGKILSAPNVYLLEYFKNSIS